MDANAILNNLGPLLMALGLPKEQAGQVVHTIAGLAREAQGHLNFLRQQVTALQQANVSLEAQLNTTEAERAAAVAECERLKRRLWKLPVLTTAHPTPTAVFATCPECRRSKSDYLTIAEAVHIAGYARGACTQCGLSRVPRPKP